MLLKDCVQCNMKINVLNLGDHDGGERQAFLFELHGVRRVAPLAVRGSRPPLSRRHDENCEEHDG